MTNQQSQRKIRFGVAKRVMAASFVVATVLFSHASFASAEDVSPVPATDPATGKLLKDGWIWLHPDGLTQGSCGEGYYPLWSKVPHYDSTATFRVAYDAHNNWQPSYNISYARVRDLIDNNQLDPKNARIWAYMFENGPETVVSETTSGNLYEGDCILEGYWIPSGLNHGQDSDVKPKAVAPTESPSPTTTESTSSPTVEPTSTPTTSSPTTSTTTSSPSTEPTPTSTTSPTPTSTISPTSEPTTSSPTSSQPISSPKPTPTRTSGVSPATVSYRLVQIDTYRYGNKRQLNAVLALKRDGKLTFREDKPFWRSSTWVIARQKLVDGKVTSTQVLRSGGNGAKLKGSKVTMTWQLGTGATAMAPWGKSGKVAQTFVK